ncbi:MAG: bacteriohemerythrin [Sideroxydans sp.]|nr:bacteriohemerythrin [Sideroxydans sp.]
MNNEEKLLAISRLVFELTITNSLTSDLDVLLERLFGVLKNYPDLQLESRGAILLLNPRGRFFQVAQYGMDPAWKSPIGWDTGVFSKPEVTNYCHLQTITLPIASEQARIVLLPLSKEGQGVGYAVLFAAPGFELNAIHTEFMSDLALALSGLVQRAWTNETLRIRELELEDARADALRSLGAASEYRDKKTGWHIMRMTNFAQAIAKTMGMSEAQRELLYVAAPMHDVGKIGIPDSVLLKPGKLTAEEYAVMKTHTEIGVTILEGKDTLIAAARDIAGSHHERWDGEGYPEGLKDEQIPLLARVCAVADVFDALTSTRPYKTAWTVEEAHAFILSESGKHFDPLVVRAFDEALPELLRISQLYRDDIIDPKQVLALPPVKHRENGWIPWDDELSVGIDVIDEHHRYLFDLINELYLVVVGKRGAREVARVVKSLDAYAKIHFRAEEKMMEHYRYEGLERQTHQHLAFENKIAEFCEELHANPLVAPFDVLFYLRDWLIHHISIEDAQLVSLK